jgi:hypothetical protein
MINNLAVRRRAPPYVNAVHDSPFGGKLDGFIPPPATIRTNVNVFNAAHSPFHISSLIREALSLRSGIQNPDLYSLCSFSLRCLIRSSWLLGGRPGLRCPFSDSSSSSSRAINLLHQQGDVSADWRDTLTQLSMLAYHPPQWIHSYLLMQIERKRSSPLPFRCVSEATKHSARWADRKPDLPSLQQQVIWQVCPLLHQPLLVVVNPCYFRADWLVCRLASWKFASVPYVEPLAFCCRSFLNQLKPKKPPIWRLFISFAKAQNMKPWQGPSRILACNCRQASLRRGRVGNNRKLRSKPSQHRLVAMPL